MRGGAFYWAILNDWRGGAFRKTGQTKANAKDYNGPLEPLCGPSATPLSLGEERPDVPVDKALQPEGRRHVGVGCLDPRNRAQGLAEVLVAAAHFDVSPTAVGGAEGGAQAAAKRHTAACLESAPSRIPRRSAASAKSELSIWLSDPAKVE
eukprot:CAMPEP_0174923334 /NCGR_PEP_ID=MMETSP1355-20121228/6520_1 /TAXON_ID=464990 /ORGANISM="Hemiselmis tepida, Strain CCMP443" /LENGTH=150 /DNA_ID=CAMNT_0016169013 /DNA_START=15 /DNA_END=469 /DNA_ORIENTATION=+